MTEKSIVLAIQRYLKALPECWFFKVHGSPMQVAGIPDIVGCYQGRFFALEVKVPGKVPTALQESVMRQIRRAGGMVGTVTSLDAARIVIEQSRPLAAGLDAPRTGDGR